MPEKISILKESGEILNSNIVSIFSIPETDKKYIITTENAVDPHGLTVFHVSEVVGEELARIATDEEWSTIKTIMRSIISGNVGPFQYQPLLEKVEVKGQYSRDISVSSSAAKQMSESYISAIKAMKGNAVSPVEENQMDSSNSIFPIDSVLPTEENEVIPGVAEIAPSNDDNLVSNSSPVIPMEGSLDPASVVTDNEDAENERGTNQGIQPIVGDLNIVNETNVEPVTNLQEESSFVQPNMEEVVVPTAETSDANEVVSDVSSQPIVVNEENSGEDLAKKDLKISPVEVVNVEVQPSSEVNPTIPDGQIVKANGNVISLNLGDISGAKTIDEIVEIVSKGFSESLRTILNVASDLNSNLSEKEARLNEREELIIQREKMINDQLMSMMNNFSSIQQMNSTTDDSNTTQNN